MFACLISKVFVSKNKCLQVAGIFHDASIGNAIHIILVRLILLQGEEVQLFGKLIYFFFLI